MQLGTNNDSIGLRRRSTKFGRLYVKITDDNGMPTTFRVMLREIANKTGISRMAVSLALRGKSGVSETTRKKVMKVAQELGYEPDPDVARMLSHIRAKKPVNMKACLALLTSGATSQ